MKRAVRIALGLAALATAGLGLTWSAIARGGEPGLLDAETIAAGRADTSELALGEAAEGAPRTLADVERLWTAEELERALAALEPLVAGEDGDPGAYVLASEVLRRLGHADRALEHAERAVRLAPHRSEAHHRHAKALARKMQDAGMFWAMRNLGTYKDAMQAAVDLDPSNARLRMEQAAFYALLPKLAGGDRERARALADELEPLDAARADWIRVMCAAVDEEPDVLDRAEAARARHPDSDELALTLAGLYQEEERWDDALATYRALLDGDEDADGFGARYQYGKCLVEAGRDLEEAVQVFADYAERAPVGLDMMPPVAGAHWRRGQALEALDRPDEARAAYEAALALDPDFDRAREALEALEALGGEASE